MGQQHNTQEECVCTQTRTNLTSRSLSQNKMEGMREWGENEEDRGSREPKEQDRHKKKKKKNKKGEHGVTERMTIGRK